MENTHLATLQDQIGYQFKDISLLMKALVAAGAEGEKEGQCAKERERYDGNRSLAQLGEKVMELVIMESINHEGEELRRNASESIENAVRRKSRAAAAKSFKIDSYMTLNPRERGKASNKTLSTVIAAVIGAVWKDANRDIGDAERVLKNLRLGIYPLLSSDPPATGFVEDARSNHSIEYGTSGIALAIGNENIDINFVAEDTATDNLDRNIAFEEHVHNSMDLDTQTHRSSDYGDLITTPRPQDDILGASDYPQTDEYKTGLPSFTIDEHKPRSSSFNTDTDAQETGLDEHEAGSSSFNIDIDAHETGSSMFNIVEYEAGLSLIDIDDYIPPLEMANTRLLPTPSQSPNESRFTESVISARTTSQYIFNESHTFPSTNTEADHGLETSGPKRTMKRKNPTSYVKPRFESGTYIELEEKRCNFTGQTSPRKGFEAITKDISTMAKGKDQAVVDLQTLYWAIASPESICGLQEIIRVERRHKAGSPVPHETSLNPIQRIKIIEDLDKNMAYNCFLRRCHVHQLFTDYDASAKNNSFVNLTPLDLERSRSRGQPGNPHYIEDSNIAKMMMQELYPNLTTSDPTYRSKLHFVRDLRNLGKRLQLLIERFGDGIIGLLPINVNITFASDLTFNITDRFLCAIPYEVFTSFVSMMDNLHGDILRRTSEAVMHVVKDIFNGSLGPEKRPPFECFEAAEVLQYPRGSRKLLGLLIGSETSDECVIGSR